MQAALLTSTHEVQVQQQNVVAVTGHKSRAFIFILRLDSTICTIAVFMNEQGSLPPLRTRKPDTLFIFENREISVYHKPKESSAKVTGHQHFLHPVPFLGQAVTDLSSSSSWSRKHHT